MMENKNHLTISVVEQIYADFFANIEKLNEFDTGLIQKLKGLVVKDEIKKHEKVAEILSLTEESKDETTRDRN